jgi:carboxypeptidase Q
MNSASQGSFRRAGLSLIPFGWAIGLLAFQFAGEVLRAQDATPPEAETASEPVAEPTREELFARFGLPEAQFDSVLKIIDEGKNRNQVLEHLRYLTQEIGPRLTASSRLEGANNWAADQFRSFGLQNVHLHEWGTFPVRFDRGPSYGKMVAPDEREFEFTTRAWSAGTDGPVRGPVLREPQSPEELEAMTDKLEGAWILRREPARRTEGGPQGRRRRGEPREDNPLMPRLYAAGIAGLITASGDELVRTGGISGIRQLEMDKLSPDVTVIVRRSDYDAINSRLHDDQDVEVEFNLDHKFTAGPIPCYNTVAEIPGTEFPEQVVIISAHLDSWDGPGSQGTVDNGTGSSVTIEAARILMAAGAKPRRTIRFILWSGEEQGLLGSRAYVEGLSEADRNNISAVFVDDSGTNREASLTCTAEMEPMLRKAVETMNYAFSDVPIELNVREGMERGGASDHASFTAVGIPGFFWGKSGRADYRYAWHTQNDKFEQGIPEYLVKNATVSALVAYVVGSADTLLPRPAPEPEADAEATPEPVAGAEGAKPAETPSTPPVDSADGTASPPKSGGG